MKIIDFKISNWHLFILLVIAFILSVSFIGSHVYAQWQDPNYNPPVAGPNNIVVNPMTENLDLNGKSLLDTGNLVIDPTGSSGFGTDNPNPAYKLEVGGKLNVTTELCINGDCQSSWPTGLWSDNGLGDVYRASGKVGIGLNAPNKELHIKTASGNAEFDIQSGINTWWGIYQDEATADLRFWNTDNRVTFTNEGRVGVGTIDPDSSYKVNVYSSSIGGIYAEGSSASPYRGVEGKGYYGVKGVGTYGLYGQSNGAGAGIRAVGTGGSLAGDFDGSVRVQNGYLQIPTESNPPPAGDCDNDAERGYMLYDYTNNRLYVCDGAVDGWRYFTVAISSK